MSRIPSEFYCSTECQKYFKTYLRSNMTGQFTIVCPNCGHHHHRVIMEGYVTDDRCNDTVAQQDIIIGLKSTISSTPYHNSPENRRSRIGAV